MGQLRVDVVQSAFWMTNTGIITAPDGSIVLVDPGVFPHELAAIADRVGERPILAAISTHEDWDHVLWSLDLPADAPRLAHPATVRVLEDDHDGFLHGLAQWEHDLGETWDHDLVGRLEPVRGESLTLGGIRIAFIPTPGHTMGHASLWLPEEGVLFAGDMLSDIDIPMLAGFPGSLDAYRCSLDLLESLLASAATMVIPGHGVPCGRDEARRRLDADRAYIEALIACSENPGEDLPPLDQLMPDESRAARPENLDAHRENAEAVAT